MAAKKSDSDVVSSDMSQSWYYSDIVKDHFFNPRNIMLKDPKPDDYDAMGMIGAPACGDMMKIWLKIDPKTEKITDMKWRTFGCASAIAATSMFSVMLTENGGIAINEALKIKPQNIMERLGGLPLRKIHCSVLADKAFIEAINEYFRKTGQISRISTAGSKVIDRKLKITDRDIEKAVLEGARDLKSVQHKLKAGSGDQEAIPEIEQLIRFYVHKYYGIENSE